MRAFVITNEDGHGYTVPCETDDEFAQAMDGLKAELETMRADGSYKEMRIVKMVNITRKALASMPEFTGW